MVSDQSIVLVHFHMQAFQKSVKFLTVWGEVPPTKFHTFQSCVQNQLQAILSHFCKNFGWKKGGTC